MLNQLEQHLIENKNKLMGEWIKNNSSYDGYICDILNMTEDTVRYWDAIWNNQYIEFKKGNSIWLDIVRYSEILLKQIWSLQKKLLPYFLFQIKVKMLLKKSFVLTQKI